MRKQTKNSKWAAILVSLSALLIILPTVAISGVIIYFQANALNLPGVFVGDKNVGMMSRSATIEWTDQAWNRDRQIQVISPDDADVQYHLSPQDLGYWVDPVETANAAYQIGRSTTPFADIRAVFAGIAHVIFPVMYYDEDLARQTLEEIAQELMVPPQNAGIIYQAGGWAATPAAQGKAIDIEKTLNHLYQNAFNILTSQSATLYYQTLQPEIADLSHVLDDVNAVVGTHMELTAYDPITDETFTWQVPEEIKRTWVVVDPDSFAVNFSIQQEDIESLIAEWEGDLGDERTLTEVPPVETITKAWTAGESIRAGIIHNPTTYQVSAGESLWAISLKLGMPMWHILDANPGLTTANISAGMTLTIPSKNILLPLPVVPEKRIVVDISEQRMTVYENGEVRNSHIISTGMSDSPTMPGIFQVQSHMINAYASNWDLYMPHFMGIYEAWPGFMNGIHGLPLLSGGGRLWASSLGSPASYGCIILDLAAAEDLYYWAEDGVVVEIRR
jgi:LysM repeat protein